MRLKRNKHAVGERKVAVQKVGGWINFLVGMVGVVIGVMALMLLMVLVLVFCVGVGVLAMTYSQCGNNGTPCCCNCLDEKK